MQKTLEERFWAKVQKTDNCWLWTGSTNGAGYGKLGVSPPRGHTELASRISWRLHGGADATGRFVLHHCDTPACVRPDHLFLGSQTDNIRDAWAKGRAVLPSRPPTLAEHTRGSAHGPARLTEEQVAEIRRRYKRGPLGPQSKDRAGTGTALAKEYGVAPRTIYAILSRKSWSHIP